MLQDWPLLAGSLGAALIPYLIERLVFGKRTGIFALLFWLLAVQFLTIYLSVAAVTFCESNNWLFLSGLFKWAGAMAFMTIGVIPFIVLPLSILIALSIMTFRLFKQTA